MNLSKTLTRRPTELFLKKTPELISKPKWVHQFERSNAKFPVIVCSKKEYSPSGHTLLRAVASDSISGVRQQEKIENIEEGIEKVIYGCRFLAILAVWGSLVGSFLCFIKGCTHVISSFQDYFVDRGKVIFSLVQAIDVYLLGTVMLVFGMGLYELFISNLDKAESVSEGPATYRSNLFGLFTLKERPQWLEIKTVNELKTKLGHVIVMLLLIGLFEKSKKAVIQSPLDLLCFSASVLLSSGCLFLLSKLNEGR
ncbi:unnamed protein product [Fraxinus pennsylvanica]|uniref:Uncharacterized protein n=1 Tax=Fraxinus pennsylvanica TaxID=56036 RepID=A0AAD1ZYE9_9LAMI|nr:unnamed protein product [Fraxinus pennsylvanica]